MRNEVATDLVRGGRRVFVARRVPADRHGASAADLKPHKLDGTMAFMIESRWVFHPTDFALEAGALDAEYDQAWDGFPKARLP